MNYFVSKFLFGCVLMQSVYGMYTNNQNVANRLFIPQSPFQDPATSMNCFSDYIVKSNEISESYGRNYKQCLLDAKSDRQVTETEMMDKRITIVGSSQDICKRLSACDGLDTTLEVFHCHAKVGANNTKDVYDISGNASEYATELQEKYRIIDLHHEQCCKTAERSYVEATGTNYRNLQGCLDGRIEPTSTTTAMTLTTSTTPSSIVAIRNTAAPLSTNNKDKPLTENFVTITSEASNIKNATLLSGTEEFAKLAKLLK